MHAYVCTEMHERQKDDRHEIYGRGPIATETANRKALAKVVSLSLTLERHTAYQRETGRRTHRERQITQTERG